MEKINYLKVLKRVCFKSVTYALVLIILLACDSEAKDQELKQGIWRGQIVAQGNEIPFNFEVLKNNERIKINLINGDEVHEIDDVKIKNDSLFFDFHVFDVTVKAKIDKNKLEGTYSKNYAEGYILPFTAQHGISDRFDNINSNAKFDGKWKTTFLTDERKEIDAIGIFNKEEAKLKGTFLTKTGDYRYLDGYVDKDTMHLFTFDGNHIYKFKAYLKNDSLIEGEFWSGKTGYRTFISRKDPNAKLPDSNKLTFLKEGFDKIEFSFPDLEGNTVTLKDKKYESKVVILQIFGSWCPNCMDETKFLSNWYDHNKDLGVEIIGLAYENKKNGLANFDYASSRVQKMKDKYQVQYDFLIAGTSSSADASKSLPMLEEVIAFPTTIFVDRQGKVRKIHTGFSGPATGKYHEDYINEFNSFMKELIDEK